MKHSWHLSFKGYRGGQLEALTYCCNSCPKIHFKEVSPNDTKFLASIRDENTIGAWTRRNNIEREHFHKDIVQPFKQDGTINKDFVKVYGTQTYEKNYGMNKEEIKGQLNRSKKYI